jgi:hypothetical protein
VCRTWAGLDRTTADGKKRKKITFGIHSFGSQANAAGFSSSYQPVGFCRVGFVIFKKKIGRSAQYTREIKKEKKYNINK